GPMRPRRGTRRQPGPVVCLERDPLSTHEPVAAARDARAARPTRRAGRQLYSKRMNLAQLPFRLQFVMYNWMLAAQESAMRRFTFASQDLDSIRYERYHHPHPRVQQKMEVLWLKSQGFTHEDIARLADVSRRSVQRYLDKFADGGLERRRRLPWKGKP